MSIFRKTFGPIVWDDRRKSHHIGGDSSGVQKGASQPPTNEGPEPKASNETFLHPLNASFWFPRVNDNNEPKTNEEQIRKTVIAQIPGQSVRWKRFVYQSLNGTKGVNEKYPSPSGRTNSVMIHSQAPTTTSGLLNRQVKANDSALVDPRASQQSSSISELFALKSHEFRSLAKIKSGELAIVSVDLTSKAITTSTNAMTEAAKVSADLTSKAITTSTNAMTEAAKSSVETVTRYAEKTRETGAQSILEASKRIGQAMHQVKQKPEEVMSNIRSAQHDLALKSAAKARQARNFVAFVFVGGCFAFGLGIGLGAGGIRRNVEKQ